MPKATQQMAGYKLLFGFNGTRRAHAYARAAVQAGVRIDGIDITLMDGADGALRKAGTACYAYVRIDFVSHNAIFLIVVIGLFPVQKYAE